jgi:hypothetical protein
MTGRWTWLVCQDHSFNGMTCLQVPIVPCVWSLIQMNKLACWMNPFLSWTMSSALCSHSCCLLPLTIPPTHSSFKELLVLAKPLFITRCVLLHVLAVSRCYVSLPWGLLLCFFQVEEPHICLLRFLSILMMCPHIPFQSALAWLTLSRQSTFWYGTNVQCKIDLHLKLLTAPCEIFVKTNLCLAASPLFSAGIFCRCYLSCLMVQSLTFLMQCYCLRHCGLSSLLTFLGWKEICALGMTLSNKCTLCGYDNWWEEISMTMMTTSLFPWTSFTLAMTLPPLSTVLILLWHCPIPQTTFVSVVMNLYLSQWQCPGSQVPSRNHSYKLRKAKRKAGLEWTT